MSGVVVEASAPARIDLAGGLLDAWPAYPFQPGATSVGVAIDRRAWCRIETGRGGVRIESKDTLATAEGRVASDLHGEGAADGGAVSLVAHVLSRLGVESGVAVVTQSRAPAGVGLGTSSALAVAVAAAAARATGRQIEDGALPFLARAALARHRGREAGIAAAAAAVAGGVTGVGIGPGPPRIERLATDPARVEECLLLFDAGAEAPAGVQAPWGTAMDPVDGAVRDTLGRIAAAGTAVREALVGHRYAEVTALVAEQWQARDDLDPGWAGAAAHRIAEAAGAAGGAALPIGRGRLVAVWAPPGSVEAVSAAVRSGGFRPVPFRVDLRGLEVEAE